MAFFQGKTSSGVDDMVLLSKVTPDQITENLRKRFQNDFIYTYIGPTLVAVNPYKKLSYFTDKELKQYRGAAFYEHPPHIYAVADKMFQDMVTDEENQCVIISGESGAGKTESAKLIMNYIAAVSGSGGDVVQLAKKIILESNPLLESFGNAKTLRNNNSSRFGKYFEINFNRGGAPSGGKISNFLLEKSRVVGAAEGERNFHIFYQMTKAAGKSEQEQLGLMEPQYFRYLNVSNEFDADGIDDKEWYAATKEAMSICGITPADQQSLFEILAGILHLGNIDFIEDQNAALVSDSVALEFPAYLFGISEELLQEKLTSRIISTGSRRGSSYRVTLNVEQARNTRDAVAKALYTRMFDWIVGAVNRAMERLGAPAVLNIGVLDIFGFEIFERNGFEQFCINFVNESLQQIFIELTLKSEQEEYAREGIQWTPIEYFNNKIVVDLIEELRPPGIMAVLDDVCATLHAQTEGADAQFAQKLDKACSQHKHFEAQQGRFVVHHYAGSVTYDCQGFTEANKDTLFKDLVEMMQSTTKAFIRNLFPEQIDHKKRPTTVSYKIKNQCHELVDTLKKSVPFYVRCIKPNENKRPKEFDLGRVDHQVRYLNLLENIKVRRAGFCYRNFFDKFLKRFAIISKQTFPHWNGPVSEGIRIIMESVGVDSNEWQIGKSKVFVKSPESLFLLEEQRERRYHHYAVIIQRCYRRYKSRRYLLELRTQGNDLLYGKKERRRFTLNRDFIGNYWRHDERLLRSLVEEQVIFADTITKYDRKMKGVERDLVISAQHLFILGNEKEKQGPNQGKIVKMVKRKIPLSQISSVSMSTLADSFLILHISQDFDTVIECILKTELVTVLHDVMKKNGRALTIHFADTIVYTVKKTQWQRGGEQTLVFTKDAAVKRVEILKNTVKVPPGLPKESRQVASRSIQKASTQQRDHRPQQVHSLPVQTTIKNGSIQQQPQAAAFLQQAKLPSPAKKKPPPVPKKKLMTCKALYSYQATEADELSFEPGDVITILSKGILSF